MFENQDVLSKPLEMPPIMVLNINNLAKFSYLCGSNLGILPEI